MIIIKGLAIIALLVGGTSVAMAQSGPPTGGQPPVAGGAAGGPPGPGVIPGGPAQQAATLPTRTRIAHQPTSRHRNMYMQGNIHHGAKMTGSAASIKKFKQNQNTYR